MNFEDQTVHVQLAMEEQFGEDNVETNLDFEDRRGRVSVLTDDVDAVESTLQKHVDGQAEKHDIDLRFTIEVSSATVVIRDIHPVPLEA